MRSFSFKRPGGQGKARQGGEGEEYKEETPSQRQEKRGYRDPKKEETDGGDRRGRARIQREEGIEIQGETHRERTETGRYRQG